jgi:hypothetical protein
MVPLAGIEPALLAELDFESSASTNSATGAYRDIGPRGEVAKPAEYSGRALPVNPRVSIRPEPPDTNCPNAFARAAQPAGADAMGVGMNRRCRVTDTAKHSSVIALHLDSARRAG